MEDNADGQRPRAERWTSSHGMSLVVRGEGIPVFLMHGIGGNANSCAALAENLSTGGYRTYCWDAPGYGESADPTNEVDHAAVVLEILAELETGPVHLFGASWGGVIAAQVAARQPTSIRSITLADSTRGSGTSLETAARMRSRPADLAAIGPRAFAAERAPRLISSTAPLEVAEAVRQEMALVRLPGYTAAANMMARTDNAELLARLQTPAHILVGADDVITGVEESRLLADIIPGATFEIIPDAGHTAAQERPAELAAAILTFWKRI